MMLKSVGQVIDNVAAVKPDQPALLFDDQTVSYGALSQDSNRFANAVLDMGIGKQDRVAFIGRNSLPFFISFFGTAKMGGVYISINWRLAPAELAALLDDAKAKMVIVEPEFEGLLNAALGGAPDMPVVVTGPAQAGKLCFDGLLKTADATAPAVDISPDDPVMQMYTSGTTGLPKGVRLSHKGVVFNRYAHSQLGDWAQWGYDDKVMLCTPGFHISAIAWIVVGLAAGATVVVIKDFVPADVLRLIEREKITQMMAVPAMMAMFLMSPDVAKIDYSSIKTWHYGASPISSALLAKSMATFKCDFVQLYGMTECSGLMTCLGPDEHKRGGDVLLSCGKPLAGTDVMVLDTEGQNRPVGEVGEVVIKTPALMHGYWQRDDDTRAVLKGDRYYTGDAGYLDAEGYLYIVDRLKDMIISGAENIYPAEVEKILMGCPGLVDVAVIGVPSAQWGEDVKAIVVAHPTFDGDEASIIAYCKQHLAGYKCPKSVDFVQALPRNASGKILKTQLRKPYWQGVGRGVN